MCDTRHFHHFRHCLRFQELEEQTVFFCGQDVHSSFSPFSSKPLVFGRGQKPTVSCDALRVQFMGAHTSLTQILASFWS